MKHHPYGPGMTLDPAGPTRDVKICLSPLDEEYIKVIRAGRRVSRSAVIRQALAAYIKARKKRLTGARRLRQLPA